MKHENTYESDIPELSPEDEKADEVHYLMMYRGLTLEQAARHLGISAAKAHALVKRRHENLHADRLSRRR